MKFTIKILALIFGALILMSIAYAESPREQLKQMVEQLQKSPDNNALREKIIKFALGLKHAPAVPEEARGHFVKAVTLQKDAKNPGDYDLPIQEYRQALLIAPWWSDAYYNLGIALELKQQYTEAIGNLKLSVMADPQGPGARAAQDKIYAIEAEQEKATGAQAAEQAAKASQDAVYAGLDGGVWRLEQDKTTILADGSFWRSGDSVGRSYIVVNGHEIRCFLMMKNLDDMRSPIEYNDSTAYRHDFWKATFTSREIKIDVHDDRGTNIKVTISNDGQTIKDEMTWHYEDSSRMMETTDIYQRIK